MMKYFANFNSYRVPRLYRINKGVREHFGSIERKWEKSDMLMDVFPIDQPTTIKKYIKQISDDGYTKQIIKFLKKEFYDDLLKDTYEIDPWL